MHDSAKWNAVKYIAKLVMMCAIGAAAFFCAAGSVNVPRGILYFTVYVTISLLGGAYLFLACPETLGSRSRIAPDTQKWDMPILALLVPLAYCGIYVAAALPWRLGEPFPPVVLYWTGIAVTVVTSVVTVWSVRENRNFESSVRIQKDRGHAVCSTGPYAVVRHPGYACMIVWAMALPMMFGLYAGIVAALVIALLVVRTVLEDAVLRRELSGYGEYSKRVRYRLLPFVW